MNGFAGKVAVVTGAGSGLGAASDRHLAEKGAAVLLFDKDETALEQVSRALSAEGLTVGTCA